MSSNLGTDRRFRVPDLLLEHGIVRSINVVVPGTDKAPFGVLEVESPEAGAFTAHDAHFLQLLAHNLAAVIARGAREAFHATQLEECTALHETVLLEMQQRFRHDLEGIYSSVADECHTADPAQRGSFARIKRYVLALVALNDHLLGTGDISYLKKPDHLAALPSPDHAKSCIPAHPESWRALACAWTEKADQLPPGSERDIYLEIAEGYADLADMDNARSRLAARTSLNLVGQTRSD